MEITKNEENGVVVFSIVGDVSIFYKDAIDAALTAEVDAGRHLFLFDFAQVSYIDSVGISFLIQAGNTAYEHGKRVAVINANPKVRYVVELAKLERIIGLFDSKEEALAELT
jgi:anti-anti-sigma factor